ncbi:hypothetical protein [Acinetobacter baumannii]|uniref:hypothetical protein n=1 Tax=Acinetobacter baumannii TaxID=470 RepID=UPI000D654472|nr:hypothetical protein [Acinetobacter baumannii]EHU2311194.1 hypothetical protein [Acinetobacter baumannii]EHU2485650.1 hypothetical protein [Acinetobacter baumannii]
MERSFSCSDEVWDVFYHPQEALSLLQENGDLEVGSSFFTGVTLVRKPSDFLYNHAAQLLENLDETLFDETGTDDEFYTSKQNYAKREQLSQLIGEWLDQNMEGNLSFIELIEEIEVTQEMIDAFHANAPIPLPEFKHKEEVCIQVEGVK